MVPPNAGRGSSRAAITLLDQVMFSACNGFVILAVARVSSVDSFGAATILFVFTAAAMSVGRGALGTVIMLSAGQEHDDLRREVGFAATAALAIGLAASGAAFVSSFLLGVPKMGAAFVLAIPAAVILVVFRYALISAARPHIAMVWDAVSATGSALLFAITLFLPSAVDEVAMVAIWAVVLLTGASGMASNLKLVPRFRGILGWWREMSGSRIRYGIEAGLGPIKLIVITSIATGVIGASAAASLRGASTLVSPLGVLLNALPLAVIPEAVRTGISQTAMWRRLFRIGLGGSFLVLVTGSALALLPDTAGELILGESWTYARRVLPIVSLEYAAMVWWSIGMSFLRFQAKSGPLLTAAVAFTVIGIILCTVMAFLTHTAVGVALGGAASTAIMAAAITIYARPARVK